MGRSIKSVNNCVHSNSQRARLDLEKRPITSAKPYTVSISVDLQTYAFQIANQTSKLSFQLPGTVNGSFRPKLVTDG